MFFILLFLFSFDVSARGESQEPSLLSFKPQKSFLYLQTRFQESDSKGLAQGTEKGISRSVYADRFPSSFLLAQTETVDAFDPFVDYNEFQDNEAEKESILFLRSGRLLTIGVMGGYEGFSLNIRQVYGDNLGVFGAYISFFFDLQFALQFSFIVPRNHYFSIIPGSYPKFSSYSIDFKYYFSKQNLVDGLAALNPYIIFGPFLMKVSSFYPEGAISPKLAVPIITSGPTAPSPDEGTAPAANTLPSAATPEEQLNTKAESNIGAKLGLGLEIPFFGKTFLGLEISYLFLPLPFEGKDLRQLAGIREGSGSVNLPTSQQNRFKKDFLSRIREPETPSNFQQKRFFGDIINAFLLIGINF